MQILQMSNSSIGKDFDKLNLTEIKKATTRAVAFLRISISGNHQINQLFNLYFFPFLIQELILSYS